MLSTGPVYHGGLYYQPHQDVLVQWTRLYDRYQLEHKNLHDSFILLSFLFKAATAGYLLVLERVRILDGCLSRGELKPDIQPPKSLLISSML